MILSTMSSVAFTASPPQSQRSFES